MSGHHACLVLRRLISEQFGFDPGRIHMLDASVQLCLENRFDPVVEYLAALKWDGTRRVDAWLITYLGAADTKLNRAIGRRALIMAALPKNNPAAVSSSG